MRWSPAEGRTINKASLGEGKAQKAEMHNWTHEEQGDSLQEDTDPDLTDQKVFAHKLQ